MGKWDRFSEELESLKKNNLYRKMTAFGSAQGKNVNVGGERLHLFASNSYLDLCNDSEIKEYAQNILEKYGVGAGGSRLTTGDTEIHEMLEMTIADFKRREAALVYNTGYMANVGIISALMKKGDVIFSDELNHASIIDGCRLSRAEIVVYKHNDMTDLENKIRSKIEEKKKFGEKWNGLIVSDGVFSMDGDIVDLPKLVKLAEKYDLLSMIDEAHATGVIGETGRGTEEHFHMEGSVDVLMGTLSKSVGSEGGFVCGSRLLIEYLKNRSRSFIFSTALSPVAMAASIAGIKKIEKEPQRVADLRENVRYCCKKLKEVGFEANSETAIIPIIIHDEMKAMNVMAELLENGYYISAIRYPTVAKGGARLRIALMSTHTEAEINGLVACLKEIMSQEKN